MIAILANPSTAHIYFGFPIQGPVVDDTISGTK